MPIYSCHGSKTTQPTQPGHPMRMGQVPHCWFSKEKHKKPKPFHNHTIQSLASWSLFRDDKTLWKCYYCSFQNYILERLNFLHHRARKSRGAQPSFVPRTPQYKPSSLLCWLLHSLEGSDCFTHINTEPGLQTQLHALWLSQVSSQR